MTNNPPIIQVNPVRAAEWSLEFLRKAPIPGEDIDRYLVARTFLQAIVEGQLTVARAPDAAKETPAPPDLPALTNGNGLGRVGHDGDGA